MICVHLRVFADKTSVFSVAINILVGEGLETHKQMSQNLTPVSDRKKHQNTDMSGSRPQQLINRASAKFTSVSFHKNLSS
jgi:hypothetical protein